MYPDYDQFLGLAQQGNFVPVYQELVADLDTPVSAWYRVCAGQPYSFLLESVEGGERLGRYSLLGCDPLWVLEARGDQTVQRGRDGSEQRFSGDPFVHLAACLAPIQPVKLPQLPPSLSGLVGFWGYELIRWIEPRVPVYPASDADLPDGLWMQIDSLLVFDQVKRKIWAVAYADLRQRAPQLAYEQACSRLQTLVSKLRSPLNREHTALTWADPPGPPIQPSSNFTRQDYCASVEQAKQYIRAGDIFQVVPSQQLSAPYGGDPFNLYRSLRQINPSPYMAYLHFGEWQLIGSSPEILVKADKRAGSTLATLRPIAGTRPRGPSPEADKALELELLQDAKELAEHVMLVDLGRNDLGRVCLQGSVKVDELMVVERYSHVMHIVSNVVGELAPGKTAWDLLRACFPAGTVSGAPKIRAMEIIHELEPCRRGPYSGAYGYYDFDGQLNIAITIRTMIVRCVAGQQVVSVQAGGGVVADSVPATEYEETLNKARGMLEAIRRLS